ncbi:Kinesin-3 [Platanthera guangdongensis]|uniref:Kinesin-3 n=1 Tax=Platanthera guangdongensis TaxID=2320717 RepID=A0ABR2M811_9ASPA
MGAVTRFIIFLSHLACLLTNSSLGGLLSIVYEANFLIVMKILALQLRFEVLPGLDHVPPFPSVIHSLLWTSHHLQQRSFENDSSMARNTNSKGKRNTYSTLHEEDDPMSYVIGRNIQKFDSLEQIYHKLDVEEIYSSQQEEVQNLNDELATASEKLKELKGNIRVFCRIRPTFPKKNDRGAVGTVVSYPTDVENLGCGIELMKNGKITVTTVLSNRFIDSAATLQNN